MCLLGVNKISSLDGKARPPGEKGGKSGLEASSPTTPPDVKKG